MTEFRAELSSAAINNLPDSAFAHIEAGGKKDDDGKTTPRKLRHYPIHDKAHADDALARANGELEGDNDDAKTIAKAALPKIKAAVAGFAAEKKMASMSAEERGTYCEKQRALADAISQQPAEGGKLSAYLHDFDDKAATYESGGKLYQIPYDEQDDGGVKLGDPQEVKPVTSYQPVESKSRNFATAKRTPTSFVEQAPPRTVPMEIRMEAGVNVAKFAGYAYTIDQRYAVTDFLGEYTEAIGPGASSKTLREQSSIPLLLNHDGLPMANTSSRTSQLSDDGQGLRNLADFDRRQGLTNDVCIALERGDISKMSFSFRAVQDAWNDLYDDRYVTELRLYDTSIVTYPANPATTAELVDEMRSAMGREGRSLWLAPHELSIRSALPAVLERREVTGDTDDLLERAVRALTQADEAVCRSGGGMHGRARTFLVANAMLELRAGKTLSAKNEGLLKNAVSALSAASDAHADAADALNGVLGSPENEPDQDGKDSNQGADNGDPIKPQDGAGPRSASLKLKRQREAESRSLRR